MMHKIKGTQDFLDMRLYNFIVQTTRAYLSRANFSEIATPIMEHTELFVRAVGQVTDIVHKEMYQIKTRDEDESICLRPEITAPIARAFVENNIQQTPWKVFTHGPSFRYERPQKGRFRQFHQVSIEIIGASSIAHDALFIKQLDTLFSSGFKLEDYALLINFLGTPQDRIHYKKIVQEFLSLHAEQLCTLCIQRKDSNTLRIFDCKQQSCQALYQVAPKITEHLSPESEEEWIQLQTMLNMLGVTYTIKSSLVRGLDYYNKTVFEFTSPHLGAQSTFCGGGRYDHLISAIGGKEDQPSIGSAFGIERLILLLEPITDKLGLDQPKELTLVVPFEQEQVPSSLLLVEQLQQAGLVADIIAEQSSLKTKLRKANRLGATYIVLLGSNELAAGTATVKNMITGSEKTISLSSIASSIKHHEIK